MTYSTNNVLWYNSLLPRNSQEKTSTNIFVTFMKLLRSTEVPLVAGQNEWWLKKHEKQSSKIWLTLAVLSQVLVLKSHSTIMPSFMVIDTSHLDNRCSVFQLPKEVSVTSFDIFDIRRCVWDGFLRASKSNTQMREKPFLLGYWHVTFLSQIVTEDETWVHHFGLKTKGTILKISRRRNLKVSITGQGHDHCHLKK